MSNKYWIRYDNQPWKQIAEYEYFRTGIRAGFSNVLDYDTFTGTWIGGVICGKIVKDNSAPQTIKEPNKDDNQRSAPTEDDNQDRIEIIYIVMREVTIGNETEWWTDPGSFPGNWTRRPFTTFKQAEARAKEIVEKFNQKVKIAKRVTVTKVYENVNEWYIRPSRRN